MLEKNIINLMYEKTSLSNLFPLIEVAVNAKQIDLMYKQGEGSFIDNLLKYYFREDISYEINYFIEKTNGNILGPVDARTSTFKKIVNLYANLSSYENSAYSTEIDNNLYSVLKNYKGNIIKCLDLLDQENPSKSISTSLYDKTVSLKLYNVAELLLAENPNCLNKKMADSFNEKKMVEKMIAAGANLNEEMHHLSKGKKPLYSLIRSNNARNEEIVSLIDDWANKNLDSKEVFENNNAVYFEKMKGSGNNVEYVLKSEKDWAIRYNKDGVSAARLAINEHLNGNGKSLSFVEKIADIQKALPALRSVDNKGENLWFDKNTMENMTRNIFVSYLYRVPFVMNNEGQAIFNKMSSDTIKNLSFVKESKYTKYMIEKIANGEEKITCLLGDSNAQEKLAERIINENLISNKNADFFANLFYASIDNDKLKDIHPKMKGILVSCSCIIKEKEEPCVIEQDIVNSDIALNSEYLINHPLLKDIEYAKILVSMIEAKELNQTFNERKTPSKTPQARI